MAEGLTQALAPQSPMQSEEPIMSPPPAAPIASPQSEAALAESLASRTGAEAEADLPPGVSPWDEDELARMDAEQAAVEAGALEYEETKRREEQANAEASLPMALQGPSDLEINQAAGLLDPIQGGFGGGAADQLVRHADARLKTSEDQLAGAREDQTSAFDDLAEASRDAAKLRATALGRSADIKAEAIDEQTRLNESAQADYEAGIKVQQGLLDELGEQREAYKKIGEGKEQTVGQRALAVIAIAFSSFGAAVQRAQGMPAQNLASDIIQQQVDNEYRRQELELAKAGKEIDFTNNAIAQTRALYSDKSVAAEAARGHIMELYIAKSEQVLASSASKETKQAAEVFIATMQEKRATGERKFAEDRFQSEANSADAARRTQASTRAAGARARQTAEERRKTRVAQSVMAERDRQDKFQTAQGALAAQAKKDAEQKLNGKPLPPGQATKSLETISSIELSIGKFDKNLSGMGVVAGILGDSMVWDQQSLVNRQAARHLFNEHRIRTTGAAAGPGELEMLMEQAGLVGARSEDTARAFIAAENESNIQNAVILFNRNPEVIYSATVGLLEKVINSGGLSPEREKAALVQLSARSGRNRR